MSLDAQTVTKIADDLNGRGVKRTWSAREQAANLLSYSLAGGTATLFLAAIERIDLAFRTTPHLERSVQGIFLTLYFSIPVLAGLLTGLAVGIAAGIGAVIRSAVERLINRSKWPLLLTQAVSLTTAGILLAIPLNMYWPVHQYVIGQIREAEKIRFLNQPLLNHERSTSYIIAFSLMAACWLLWALVKYCARLNRPWRYAVLAGILLLTVLGYWANSRIEVQLYEHSLHRSLFLLTTGLAMSLVAGIYFSSELVRRGTAWLKRGKGLVTAIAAGVLLVCSVGFTFQHINRDQTLKVLVFYRTINAKTEFQLMHWILDRDGDGYSALLGGGDPDDSQRDVNPSAMEIVGDGIDNNGIGGDLTPAEIAAWHKQFTSARVAPDPNAKRLNVIYIFVDALRADHLGVYGYRRNTSPNLDRLAARSTVFVNGFTPAPNTFEALPKFMKSCYWDAHVPTWTEELANNGYDTMLFPRRLPVLIRHVKGMKEIYQIKGGPKDLKDTIDNAINILGERSSTQPFCAYLYAFNPHRPYIWHHEFDYGHSTTDLYDGEVAYTDHYFGKLFDWLDRSSHMKDTMIVFMADHGESLGERLVYKHSTQLYDEQEHIPMIVYMPGVQPRRVTDYVSSVDLGATILSAVGLECPDHYAGVSLLPLMRGVPMTHPPIYAEQSSREVSPFVRLDQQVNPVRKKYMVITQDGFKFIYDRDFDCFELYDLRRDPDEVHNLYDDMPERAARMRQMVGRYIDMILVSRPSDADEQQYVFRGTGATGADDGD